MIATAPGPAKISRDAPEIIAEVQRRFGTVPPPDPPDFDPSEAEPDQLRKLGIPPKPDPALHPEYFRLWSRIYGRKLRFVQTAFDLQAFLAVAYRPFYRRELVAAESRIETSENWSGAYITANDDKTFDFVAGMWKVPTPKQPASAPSQSVVDYACSTWIGLDGQRRYRNSSLPQIGTSQTLKVAGNTQTLEAQAWTQWWARGQINVGPIPITILDSSNKPVPFPVGFGDIIACGILVVTPSAVIMTMVNLSTTPIPTIAVVPVLAPSFGPIQLEVSGATAEWVMERPTIVGTTDLANFPDYGDVDFPICFATESPAPLGPQSFRVLDGARFIRMYEVPPDRRSTRFISMPARKGSFSIGASYGDFKT